MLPPKQEDGSVSHVWHAADTASVTWKLRPDTQVKRECQCFPTACETLIQPLNYVHEKDEQLGVSLCIQRLGGFVCF